MPRLLQVLFVHFRPEAKVNTYEYQKNHCNNKMGTCMTDEPSFVDFERYDLGEHSSIKEAVT